MTPDAIYVTFALRQWLLYNYAMETTRLSIGELADAAGISRRAIRFYVQRGLLPPPYGQRRGSSYDQTHVERLRQIRQLQEAGHSLDAISRILSGEAIKAPPHAPRRRRITPAISAGLWTRITLGEGVELLLDASRFNPEVEQVLAIKTAVTQILGGGSE